MPLKYKCSLLFPHPLGHQPGETRSPVHVLTGNWAAIFVLTTLQTVLIFPQIHDIFKQHHMSKSEVILNIGTAVITYGTCPVGSCLHQITDIQYIVFIQQLAQYDQMFRLFLLR